MTILLLLISFFIVRVPDDGPMVPPSAVVRPVHSATEGARGKECIREDLRREKEAR